MADLATLQARLSEAEAALHKLMTGRGEVSVGHGDKQVTFTKANTDGLQSYIRNLEYQIRRLQGLTGRRPIYVTPL